MPDRTTQRLGNRLERPTDPRAHPQLISSCGHRGPTIEVVPEGEGKMKIVDQFDVNRIIGGYANTTGVGKTRKYQQLRIEFADLKANQAVLQSQQALHILIRRPSGGSVKRLVNKGNAGQPGKVAVGGAFEVVPVAATQRRAQRQILLAAVQKIGQSQEVGISVQKLGKGGLQVLTICLGRSCLAAKRGVVSGRHLPRSSPIRGIGVDVQCRLAIAA
jgi:hypothetical protein